MQMWRAPMLSQSQNTSFCHTPIALLHETNHRSWHNSWWVWTPRPQKAKLARWRWFPLHPQARKTASTVHVWSFLLNFAPVWSIVWLCVAISAKSANSAIQSVHGWSHYLTLLTAPTAKATRSTSSSFEPVQTSSEKTPWNQCPKTKHDMIRMTAQRRRCWFRTMLKHKTLTCTASVASVTCIKAHWSMLHRNPSVHVSIQYCHIPTCCRPALRFQPPRQ